MTNKGGSNILIITDAPSPSGKAGDFDSPIAGSTPAGATEKSPHGMPENGILCGLIGVCGSGRSGLLEYQEQAHLEAALGGDAVQAVLVKAEALAGGSSWSRLSQPMTAEPSSAVRMPLSAARVPGGAAAG